MRRPASNSAWHHQLTGTARRLCGTKRSPPWTTKIFGSRQLVAAGLNLAMRRVQFVFLDFDALQAICILI